MAVAVLPCPLKPITEAAVFIGSSMAAVVFQWRPSTRMSQESVPMLISAARTTDPKKHKSGDGAWYDGPSSRTCLRNKISLLDFMTVAVLPCTKEPKEQAGAIQQAIQKAIQQ